MVKNILSDLYTKGRIQKAVTLSIFVITAVFMANLLEYICQGYVLGPSDPILAQYLPPGGCSEHPAAPTSLRVFPWPIDEMDNAVAEVLRFKE